MTARTLTCRVAEVEDLTPDVFRVYLEGRAEAVAHAAGQYLELDIGEGEWVPFSIANAHGGDGRIELHIQHWPERSNSAKLRELLVEPSSSGCAFPAATASSIPTVGAPCCWWLPAPASHR